MNKNKELAKNTIIITIGKICTQFISFLLLPFYTALLSTEQYGAVDLIATYVQLLLPILIFQIDQAVFRYLIDKRKDKDKISQLISSVFAFMLLQFVIFTGIFLIVLIWFKSEYKWFLYINVLAAALSSILLQITRGIGDNGTYAIASFLAGFFTVILNVVFIAGLNMKAEGVMLATFISNVICTIYIFYKEKVYKFIYVSMIKKTQIKEMLRYSLPLIPNALSWWVVNASDRSIVLMFLGTSANGILATSHKFSTMVTSFYSIFNISWTESAILHLKENDRNDFFSNIVDIVYRIFICCCIGIIACMPFVFPIMINESYSDAYYQIPIYMIAAMFNILAGLYSVVYIANKKTSEIAKTSIIAGIINIIINFVLIRFIGLYAASISSAVAYATMAIYRHFDIRKYIKQTVNFSLILSSVILLVVVTAIYYSKIKSFQLCALIITIIYSIFINFKFGLHLFNICKSYIKKKL